MRVCPYHCGWCDDPACQAEGCRHTGTPPLIACEQCGELHEPYIEPVQRAGCCKPQQEDL